MRWKLLEGYKYTYRVSDQGEVQKQLQSGKWRTLKPYPYGGQWRVGLQREDDTTHLAQVAKLVVDAFMGGTPPGTLRVHRNGVRSDNAVGNIIFLTRLEVAKRHRPGNSRPVLKIDRDGNVVEIYRSGSEAARVNHISQAAMSRHCLGLVDDPYHLDGYRYTYEDKDRGRPKK